ncbi:hypothetical protein MD484_g1679, partial [Candolleomyces efflorescens]
MKLWSLLLLLHASYLCRAQLSEYFDEKLVIKPLKDGKVAATLTFTTLLQNGTPRDPALLHTQDESQHYTLFPLALGQVLREYGVTEMHLSLNAGKWDYDAWGHPVESGVGTGAELWAWIGDGGLTSVDARWQGLRNALAGLFCSSLGSLDSLRTTSPARVFPPQGSLPPTHTHQLRHASHPSENVCTENLTPFIKLLPCKASAGLARLLNPHKLFDANWHGLGVHVTWDERGVRVEFSVQAVFDPLRSSYVKKQVLFAYDGCFGGWGFCSFFAPILLFFLLFFLILFLLLFPIPILLFSQLEFYFVFQLHKTNTPTPPLKPALHPPHPALPHALPRRRPRPAQRGGEVDDGG